MGVKSCCTAAVLEKLIAEATVLRSEINAQMKGFFYEIFLRLSPARGGARVSSPTSMEEKICSELKLAKLRQQSLNRSLNEIHEQASSILSLTLQWKDIETHFESTFNSIEDSAKALRTKERQLEAREKEFESKEKEFEERCEEFIKLRDAEIEEHYKEIELKEKDFEERRREVDLERKRLESETVDYSIDANLHFSVKMDGRALQMFLNKRCKHDEKMKNEMTVDDQHNLDVLGFFYLLAAYGLASAFDSDELISRLVIIARNREIPEFLRVLELGDKIPGFIQTLINKKQYIDAINFIYAFELVKEFRPVPLLKNYLKDSKIVARNFRRSNKSVEALIMSKEKRVADLRAVIKCIEDHKLEPELSPKFLQEKIAYLEMEISNKKAMLLALGYSSQIPILNENKCSEPKSTSTASTALNTLTAASTAIPPVPTAPITVTSSSPTTASTATPAATTTITSSFSTSASTSTSIPNTSPIPAPTSSVRFGPPSQTTVLPSATISKSLAQQHCGNKLPQPQHQGGDEGPQPQHQGRNKRPRIAFSSEVPLQASSFANPNIVHSLQTPHQQPGHCFMNQGASYLNSSAGHYSLIVYQPINPYMNYNYYNVNSYYHSNTLGAPGYGNATPFQRR
ncbi:hypothetical protein D5086_009951 [Populus alba]|uniref:Uncharacterized protein n=1 Tax=Populus alba TaxID=43335 RepID=A0ACC4C8M1_POPAL